MATVADTLNKWCSAEGIEFNDPIAENRYKARAGRIADVIQLKKPDRVPVWPSFGMFPALDNGMTIQDAMNDINKASVAWLKTLTDFEPDACMPPTISMPAAGFEALGYHPLKLPGRDVPPSHIYQFEEREFIKAEDFYDAYLSDPTDFMLRTFLPTVCKTLEPLRMLPRFTNMLGYANGLLDGSMMLAAPDVREALLKWIQAGDIIGQFYRQVGAVTGRMAVMGYPNPFGGVCSMPFDIVGDWFRGTRGVMLDMFRYPERLKAVMAQRVPLEISYGVGMASLSGAPIVGLMLHKGSREFLSIKQFEEFYWPGLRDVMLGIIEAGYVPMPLFEGDYNTRLEIIKDIPKGKAIYWFEEVNIYEAKKVLGDRVCIKGNVPGSMLQLGTPGQVEDYVKELIDVFGKDGGLIVDCGIWFDEAKHENVKALVDTVKTYG